MKKNFIVSKYEVAIEAGDQGLFLPAYKGSTLRGGFGSAFNRIACSQRNTHCRACFLRTSCPYAYIFETAPPPGSAALRNYESIPRPFVLEPPLEARTEYRPGEKICFNLILIGRAIGYLPYFIVAFRELGEMGIGRGRKKYRLAEIRAVDPAGSSRSEVVYHREDQLVRNVNLALESDIEGEMKVLGGHSAACSAAGPPAGLVDGSMAGPPVGSLVLEFQTMTRIKFEENFARRLEFHVLVRSLLRRLSSLAYFNHGWEPDLDFTGLIDRAAEVRIIGDDTRNDKGTESTTNLPVLPWQRPGFTRIPDDKGTERVQKLKQ